MLRPLEGLHRHHAHVLFAASTLDEVAELGPDPVVVREHHDVEAPGVDGGFHYLHEVRRVGREADEAELALFAQAVGGFVEVRVHDALDGVARVHVGEVRVIGAQAPEAVFDDLLVVGDGAAGVEVPPRRTEFRGDEDLVTHALDGVGHDGFAAGGRVVGRGVDVGDTAVDGAAHDLGALRLSGYPPDATRAHHDVRDHPAGAAETPVALHASSLPRVRVLGVGFLGVDTDTPPGAVPAVVTLADAKETAQGARPSRQSGRTDGRQRRHHPAPPGAHAVGLLRAIRAAGCEVHHGHQNDEQP